MNRWSIQRSLDVEAPVAAVWRHIGDPEQVSRWWCPPPTVHIRFEPYPGSRYEERYQDATYAYEASGAVIAYEPPRRLAIQRHTRGRFGPVDDIEIILIPDGNRTSVILNHSFDQLSQGLRREAHDFYADGWSDSLNSLRHLATATH